MMTTAAPGGEARRGRFSVSDREKRRYFGNGLAGSYDDFAIRSEIKKGECNLPEQKEGGAKNAERVRQ